MDSEGESPCLHVCASAERVMIFRKEGSLPGGREGGKGIGFPLSCRSIQFYDPLGNLIKSRRDRLTSRKISPPQSFLASRGQKRESVGERWGKPCRARGMRRENKFVKPRCQDEEISIAMSFI